MDTFARDVGDERDLDELMARVREAALGPGARGSATAAAQAPGDTAGGDSDFIRIIDAQSQLNEHTRKALAELVECLRTLRDDWGEAQKALRHETVQLSALVRKQRRTPDDAALAGRKPSVPAARDRRTIASRRANRVRHAAKGGRQRS